VKKQTKTRIELISAIIIPLLLVTFIRAAGFSEENSLDCYYHIKIADAGPSCYMSKQFPKLTMSTWSERFSDKELGYHLLLSTVRKIKSFLSADMSPPFDLEALFFAYLAITSFVSVLWYLKVRHIWVYSLLFVIASPFFNNRLLMLRPHNLSIALMLLSLPVLLQAGKKSGKPWKNSGLWMLFVLAFITSWCYSNPHFILLPTFAVGFAMFIKNENRKLACLLPFIVLAGLIGGYILHPQFPNTFINWKIQCVDVVRQAVFRDFPVTIGNEFKRPGWLWLLKNSGPFLLFLYALFMISRLIPKKQRVLMELKNLPGVVIASGLISIITLLGVFAGIRAMEYAAPFSIIFAAVAIKEYSAMNLPLPRPFSSPNIPRYSRLLIAVLAFAFMVCQIFHYSRIRGFRPLNDFSKWMQESGIPENSVIANLIWSDFPFLYYSCPQYRYLSGLDPMFSYDAYPEEMTQIENFRRIKITLTPKEVSKLTGSDYAFVRKPYKRFAKYIIKMGYVPIYEGDDGWLFDLRKSEIRE
jgi:hypothetical protein